MLVALTIGVVAGLFSSAMTLREGAFPDLLYPLTAARFFLDGQNPYDAMRGGAGNPPPFDGPLYYPFTAVLALTPLAALSTRMAVGLFFGASSALLAFAITRDALWRVHVFASAPFVAAAALGQFSPLITFAALVPAAGVLYTLKPNLGLAILIRQPTRIALLSCAIFGLLTLAIAPYWLQDWLEGLRQVPPGRRVHEIPLLQMGGWLLLLSLLGIRRPNGRLLAAMSVLPQALFFYDQLPLWLVAENRRQSIFLTACSQAAMVLWWVMAEPGDSVMRSAYPLVTALIYLPALALVLRNAKRASGRVADARLHSSTSRD